LIQAETATIHAANHIDSFIDTLWLEDGLSKNTLEAYRRDLTLYAQWLTTREKGDNKGVDETVEADINSYFSAKHNATKATSANRRLTVLKRYFRWAMRERFITADPTLKLQAAKQALRVPKTMTEAQVEALLDAPDTDTPLGLRDRTMLELMYASGLRVSELVTLKVFNLSMNEGVLRVIGKGNKERLVPFGEVARLWIERYLANARQQILGQQQTQDLLSPT
jgi:integrase/recombinase XerD